MSDTKKQLKEYMDESGATQTAIGRAINYSGSTVSQYLDGIYRGDIPAVEKAIAEFLERARERATEKKADIPFVKIKAAKKFFEISRICHVHGEFGVVYGDAGSGKTIAAREYDRKYEGVILIETDETYNKRVLLSELHKKCGFNGKGNAHVMMEKIIEKLKGSSRLIIIDEAENLPRKALEVIRRVGDKTGVGIVLTGMERLVENLRGSQGDFAQMYSRIGVAAKLGKFTPEDTQAVVHTVLPNSNGAWKYFHEISRQNGRRLSKLLKYAPDVAKLNGEKISRAVIEKTAEMLIV